MPDPTPRLQIPIPSDTEGDDIGEVMKKAFLVMEMAGVPKVSTTAERDAKFGGEGPGAVIIVTSPLSVWIKTAAGWSPLWSDTGWINVTLSGGWVAASPLQYRVKAGVCYWRGLIQQPEGYIAQTPITVCNVPTAARPPTERRWTVTAKSGTQATLWIADGIMGYWATTGSAAFFGCPDPYLVD